MQPSLKSACTSFRASSMSSAEVGAACSAGRRARPCDSLENCARTLARFPERIAFISERAQARL